MLYPDEKVPCYLHEKMTGKENSVPVHQATIEQPAPVYDIQECYTLQINDKCHR